MKKALLLLAACAFTTAAFAQTPETEVKVRDNGTKKVVTKTGKTNVGAALENTVDAAGNVAKKAGRKSSTAPTRLAPKPSAAARKSKPKLKTRLTKAPTKKALAVSQGFFYVHVLSKASCQPQR